MNLSIGELSRRSEIKVPTIRYYEKIGLIPEVPRNAGNQRRYGAVDLDRLKFIRHARDLGFDLDSIRDLLEMSERPLQSCHAADSIARTHLEAIRARIHQLTLLQHELERMVSECRQGRVCDCRVIEVLANHAECTTDHGRVAPARPGDGPAG
ncbi:MerR family transcriptional regulator [Pukyongiella litopenaei]|uniref:Helix-turn-helix domain-containing protein n=1 Tax=Pukyongiella litopenaei TaxID=2605946 RepID=A0A2S0MU19_9RHOB|nr:helix-turn-helix domain-containing protein [Pukyongiella litopenaei]AVO39394.1 helix-turn-helix domain-containing protein [Pukyongiella litopenaei]